ncbi:MAG: hypothetical protein A2W52_04845 [Candidatus Taylorbacteria bacterium RIFCSPHIGHO2_02_49_25]|uniref:Bacterial sugar transferase domain-containing protein n=1 Tax=Candidatus Taylorbacteria bacterium RIFCSPHIGHO2_02_49_25 TaxID=1802305 RepID=A0A1G2MEN8_9BACT|nr:MAG: Exopolysaccharide production protein [Parcubacteria group bacterium GW2011_GWF2_50_9]OHA21717.1 MAG: hypothetical protein A2759_02295 [Candidatus Taylorbacteria bacterium RIFCSPHIGHO2_01_FULL_49_60]OHA22370.1 MAG: hypothetical protein A2W52_04845 [Candidatus Taylorbacteria bacterium RIFCSPHIGHO2_02_49_25]OHA35850.1 MAG: hypothetical protein A2W65_03605 [Candidatus Taylorbacteria bacterium RIFCSPLOWO2_02_50_13]OHA37170.1 MAG: hypothetical protein A3B27_02675 [Candidatus Taylorbacteria ba
MNAKRIFDIVCSCIAIVLLLPLFAAIALLIKLTSREPVFFCQRRMGFMQTEFTILKFRTLQDGTGRAGIDLTSKSDPRITAIGRFLRRNRFDELPQFFNVICGDMSVVGPRPCEITTARQFINTFPTAVLRHCVKPDITGLAQINGRQAKTLQHLENDFALDCEYIDKKSLTMDIVICLKPPLVMFSVRGI